MEVASVKDRIIQAVGDTAGELGYLVYDASVLLRGENSRVIVKIDHLRGISHHDCEIYSRGLTNRLDGMKVLPNYSLEVSSPGLDRKLRTPDEFARFAGAPVKIIFVDKDLKRAIKGTITGLTGDSVRIDSEEGELVIGFSRIVAANLAY